MENDDLKKEEKYEEFNNVDLKPKKGEIKVQFLNVNKNKKIK